MPKRRRESCEEPSATAGNDNRLGSFPNDALLHVLSLLPSEDAVRTCVLARRWRHLWRFTAALRIASDDDKRWSVRWLHRFVTNFLRLRYSLSPLDVCDIFCCPFVSYRGGHAAQAFCFKVAEEWVRSIVSEYRARVLNVWIYTPENMLEPADAPLVSQHLTRVELGEVELPSGLLDLSGCPALEHLELISCRIQGERMLFPSVKHLRITHSSFGIIPRCSISAPSLVSLQLYDNRGFTPVLESMPSPAKAFVRFDDECCDKCPRNYYGDCGHGNCDGCYGNLYFEDDEDNQCVLLEGWSGTTNLELIALPELFVCRKDFKWRPIFRKLKTLSLNEWCVADDFNLLIYFLQHSPILEKITLQLSKLQELVGSAEQSPTPNREWSAEPTSLQPRRNGELHIMSNRCHSPWGGSMVSKCLKAIEVKYQDDGVFDRLLTILNTYGVSSVVVTIQKKDSLSFEKFSFEQKDED